MKGTLWITAMLLVVVVHAAAASGIAIGVKSGIVDNYDQPDLRMAGYNIDQLTMIGGQIHYCGLPVIDLIVSGDYLWRQRTYTIAGQDFEFKIRDFAVTASVVYPVSLPMVTPYIGGGIGSHSLSYEYIRPISLALADNGVVIPETSAYFGYHGMVGAKIEIPAFPVGFFMEGRVYRIDAPGEDIRFNTWAGGVYLSLR